MGVQVKLRYLENTCHAWALLRCCFTTKRRYINCMHLYFYLPLPLLMVTIWLELCTYCSSSCHHRRPSSSAPTSCRWAATTICPRPSPPHLGAEARCAAEQTAT